MPVCTTVTSHQTQQNKKNDCKDENLGSHFVQDNCFYLNREICFSV